MNPSNNKCPSDIASFSITDYRPSKSLYVNVKNNNDFRIWMQHNGYKIMRKHLQNFSHTMNCSCEPKYPGTKSIPKFDSSLVDGAESGVLWVNPKLLKKYEGHPGGAKTNIRKSVF